MPPLPTPVVAGRLAARRLPYCSQAAENPEQYYEYDFGEQQHEDEDDSDADPDYGDAGDRQKKGAPWGAQVWDPCLARIAGSIREYMSVDAAHHYTMSATAGHCAGRKMCRRQQQHFEAMPVSAG